MAKKGFRRNAKTVSNILKNDPGLKAAVRAAAEKVAGNVGSEAVIVEFETDRYVAGVQVGAVSQARDGVATRAAGASGLRPR